MLAGQSLIRAAELRSVATEFNRYVTATQTFRDKYFALPGDMNNATSFWNAIDPTPATCIVTASTTAATCNGNGDGAISENAFTTLSESWHFWKHLANAGLIEGTYNGVNSGAVTVPNRFITAVGVNVPASKIAQGGWMVFKIDYAGPNTTIDPTLLFQTTYGNSFSFGKTRTARWTYDPILKPEEAWNIDTKLDDGLPAQGKIITQYGNLSGVACNTSTSTTDFTGTYNLTGTGIACSLFFRGLF